MSKLGHDEGRFYVYTLAYPESMGGKVFYVGKGSRHRISVHAYEAKGGLKESNPYKCNVIRKIWANHEEVNALKVAHFVSEGDAFLYETALIFFMQDLTNLTDGGEGKSGYTHTEVTRHKLSEIAKRRGFPEEATRRATEVNRGRVVSEETRKKISAAHKGQIVTEEARLHLSEINKGKKHSEETRRKMSEARKGKKRPPFSEEHCRKISEAHKGKKLAPRSEETRRKMSEARKGYRFTEEHRLNISNAKKLDPQNRIRDAKGHFIKRAKAL